MATKSIPSKNKTRKKYRKPELENLGDLRTFTLGGSPGLNDSGGQFTRRPPGMKIKPGMLPPLPGEYPQPGDPPLP
jgi:hypothetical protein